jgi:hypothetical protein
VRAVAQDNAGQAADHGKAADDGADETEAPETEAPETEAPEAGGHGNGHGQGAAHGG